MNFRKIRRKKLKGGALYIAIMVSVIIGCVLSLFLLVTNYNQRSVTVYSQSSQLNYNIKSAFEMAQSAYFTPDKNYTWIKNEINDDSIRIKKMNWGAYIVLAAETKNRHHFLSHAGIFGAQMSADTALLISDNSRPVALSGNILLKANCYFPSAGIKPAYIEGQSYISSPQNAAHIKKSPSTIPQINPDIFQNLKSQLTSLDWRQDSSVASIPENHKQAFNQKTIVWQNSNSLLSKLSLSNNIKLVCGDVEIDSTNHLNNILIVCNKVRFKKGFKGKIHVIARDSISMEEACTFQYPSSFVLLPDENAAGFNYIQFNKDCVFFGGVLALSPKVEGVAKVFIKCHAASEINGFVYTSDYIHLEGKVNATVIANKLLLKTPSAVYENHMLACELNPGKYANVLAIPSLFNAYEFQVCEYLN